jgi:hypothetical protein
MPIAYQAQWPAVAAKTLTANATAAGLVSVASTDGFYVGQVARLAGTALPNLDVLVLEVISPTQLYVGAVGNFSLRGRASGLDVSAYTTAATSTISASQQNRAGLPTPGHVLQTTYEQEPIKANRSLIVDPLGQPFVKLPAMAQLAAAGQSWVGMSALQTPLNAVPTTTAPVSLWNGESANGLCYVIDSIFLFNGVTQALATNFSLMVMENVGVVSAPSGGSSITPKGTTGKAYGGNAQLKSGTTVVNDVWMPFGTSLVDVNAADFGAVLDIPVNGLYIVRPGGCFSIAGLVATAPVATSVQLGIRWHERQMMLT